MHLWGWRRRHLIGLPQQAHLILLVLDALAAPRDRIGDSHGRLDLHLHLGSMQPVSIKWPCKKRMPEGHTAGLKVRQRCR